MTGVMHFGISELAGSDFEHGERVIGQFRNSEVPDPFLCRNARSFRIETGKRPARARE